MDNPSGPGAEDMEEDKDFTPSRTMAMNNLFVKTVSRGRRVSLPDLTSKLGHTLPTQGLSRQPDTLPEEGEEGLGGEIHEPKDIPAKHLHKRRVSYPLLPTHKQHENHSKHSGFKNLFKMFQSKMDHQKASGSNIPLTGLGTERKSKRKKSYSQDELLDQITPLRSHDNTQRHHWPRQAWYRPITKLGQGQYVMHKVINCPNMTVQGKRNALNLLDNAKVGHIKYGNMLKQTIAYNFSDGDVYLCVTSPYNCIYCRVPPSQGLQVTVM